MVDIATKPERAEKVTLPVQGFTREALEALSASTPVEGFGSSDCRRGCPSHLARLVRPLSPSTVLRRLGLDESAEAAVVLPPAQD